MHTQSERVMAFAEAPTSHAKFYAVFVCPGNHFRETDFNVTKVCYSTKYLYCMPFTRVLFPKITNSEQWQKVTEVQYNDILKNLNQISHASRSSINMTT